MIKLPSIEEVKQANIVSIVKQLIAAVQYLNDKQGDRDTELYQILVDNQKQTNTRLDEMNDQIVGLRGDMKEQTELLRAIVNNIR